jgi:hypothetical protein
MYSTYQVCALGDLTNGCDPNEHAPYISNADYTSRKFNYNKSERLTIQTKVAKYSSIMLT